MEIIVTNRRGITVIEPGFSSKESSKKRQFLETSLFSSTEFREHSRLRAGVKKIITFIIPMSGRIDNVIRFVRNWKQIYDFDKNIKLVISLSANPAEYNEVTTLFEREFAAKRKIS